jgi:Cu+-exporting ATPase
MREQTVLNVEGMTCANCAQNIARLLEKQGKKNVHVDFQSGEVAFDGNGDLAGVVAGIRGLGYRVADKPTKATGRDRALEIRLGICLAFTLPLWLHMLPGLHGRFSPLLQLLLCLPVMAVGLQYFGKSAWGSLRALDPNMDVLITLGSLSAFLYSVAGLVLHAGTPQVHDYLFFETAATIITFVLLGNLIEKRSLRRTVSALEALARLQPEKARRVAAAGTAKETFEEIDAAAVRSGDLLQVNTGDRFPADGRVEQGEAGVDESTLTGESAPAAKGPGDAVLAGTVAVSGGVRMRAEKTAGQTVLSGVIDLVKKAQASKPRLQRLGDRVSAVFVPVVAALAVLTFLLNFFAFDQSAAAALMRAVAVLVVACPCAMGLATPTAVSVGLGRAARNGILVRSGAAMESFGRARIFVFDKTGTLTTGKFKLRGFRAYGHSEAEAKAWLYRLEKHSSHPIAVSLAADLEQAAAGYGIVGFKNVQEEKGAGLRATGPGGEQVLAGSYDLVKPFTNEAGHSVYLVIDGRLAATADLEDAPRPGAAEAVSFLHGAGLRTVLLSGDTDEKCRSLAAQVGIGTVYSRQLPHQKTEVIERLKRDGAVAMVGDGVNDAPSLAVADAGVSFGDATGIAVNSAQVILLKTDDMASLVEAYKTGRATVTTIKQNLFWAFFYNVLMIPLAAAGFLSPMLASLSMAFSDVIVIGNSLRLRYRGL